MSFIYALTLTLPPRIDTAALSAVADDYKSLASAATTTATDVASAVNTVAGANEGSTVDGFLSKTRGAGSAANHLNDLSAAASRTATAYTTVAHTIEQAKISMDSIAKSAEKLWFKAYLNPLTRDYVHARLIIDTKRALTQVEVASALKIKVAYASIGLPAPFAVEYYSALPPEIVNLWKSEKMTPEMKRKLLQKLADQHADRLGIPRKKLEFYNDPGDDSMGVRRRNGTVAINEAYFDDPNMLGVPVHEMQHSAQYVYMDEYDKIPKGDVDDIIAGRKPDPLQEKYGVSTADVQRLKEGNANHVRDKGYWERPVEIDARRSGDRFTDDLTVQELQKMIDAL